MTGAGKTSAPPARDAAAGTSGGGADDDEAKPIALAPLAGYATEGLKLGIGARASYTFANHLSVAGTFVYHFGSSAETPTFRGTASSSVRAFYPAAEVGYDVHLEALTIRPYAAAGVVFVTASSTLGDQEVSDTKSRLAIYPGVTATYAIPQTSLFAGADARLLIVPDGGDPSFGMFATFGVKL